MDLDWAVEEYQRLAHELEIAHPDAISEADTLAAAVIDPRVATADQLWSVIWNKPLFANTRVGIAVNKIESVKSILSSPKIWNEMRHDNGEFAITHVGKGSGRDAFEVIGAVANNLVEEHRVAPHRLYAIIGAAQALTERERRSANPMNDLNTDDMKSLVSMLRSEAGFGWGAITVLHMLTDLGLAVKPDIWLTTTAISFGVIVKDRRLNKISDILAVDAAVKEITKAVYGSVEPQFLRKVDKIMMEIGKRGLLKGE